MIGLVKILAHNLGAQSGYPPPTHHHHYRWRPPLLAVGITLTCSTMRIRMLLISCIYCVYHSKMGMYVSPDNFNVVCNHAPRRFREWLDWGHGNVSSMA
ncbi:hypothetical protein GOBAR_AA36446 [Gossypium barbadense]|uniref:Uncharacterized protein n=1 Tax=Gossypium barbadense TaxID=3634 RepID=A0A2P5VZK3_GOSBA|nr:hypothetical protein GOBAR_AA36446 [Gossypium barbadense]